MRVFVTGLTGTLGTALARLHAGRGDQVFGCSRSEARAVEWLNANKRVAVHFLCDVATLTGSCDAKRMISSSDRVYHCAAMKHVDLCEQQPAEAFRQNVQLTELVGLVCRRLNVPLVHVSSDKACMPQGVYGATKLLAERIALREGAAVVRLGNLVGSSGSVFQLWQDAAARGEPLKLTDPEMTRYFIGVEQAAEFAADQFLPGRVVIPNPLKCVRMGDVVDKILDHKVPNSPFACKTWKELGVEIVGPRPGETRHQWLIAPGEPMEVQDGRLVLGEGKAGHDEWSSRDDKRWCIGELLALAGIK